MFFVILKKRTLLIAVTLIVCAILLSIDFVGGAYAKVYFNIVPRLVPIYSVDTPQKQVAISFDSAWGADKTIKILEILKEFDAGATFFLVGFWVDKYPDMVKAIDDFGIEIGTHSNTHPDFVKLNATEMEQELSVSITKIKDVVNKEVTLFRAPFGSYNNTLINTAIKLGLYTIQWDVDTLDWKGLSAIEITNRVLNKVKNGSIILCHNNADHIVEALPMVLDRLHLQGYKVTSVGDLIYKQDYSINHLGIQRKNV